eukprot:2453214-Rhodomonas_salina.1
MASTGWLAQAPRLSPMLLLLLRQLSAAEPAREPRRGLVRVEKLRWRTRRLEAWAGRGLRSRGRGRGRAPSPGRVVGWCVR